jgi:hypothetical protein
MRRTFTVLFVALVLLTGCAQYLYTGMFPASDVRERSHDVVVYWTATERLLWFNEYSGGVRLLPECSTDVMDFEEKADGIAWRVPEKGVCGTIEGARRVRDLHEGGLKILISCAPQQDEFTVFPVFSLLPEKGPYTVDIKKRKIDDPLRDIPLRPKCRYGDRGQ